MTFKWASYQDNNFVAGATSTNVGATSPAVAPGAFAAGDILLAHVIEHAGTGDTIVPPSGWTQIGTQVLDNNNFLHGWFWHLCTGSETGSFTFTWTTSNFSNWTLVNYSSEASSPVDVSVTQKGSSGGATSVTTSSVTTTNSGDTLILMAGSNSITFSAPGDMMQRILATQESSTAAVLVADRAPGTTGTFAETYGVGATFTETAYLLVALKPSGGGAARAPTLTLMGVG